MKRLIIGLVAALAVFGTAGVATSQNEPVPVPTEVNQISGLTNMIDSINVPWEILEYVQMKYEGHAVTHADKVSRNGKELYRLRVDNDTVENNSSTFALIFDMEWKLVSEEKIQYSPPKPPEPEQPAPAASSSQEPTEEERPEKPDRGNDDSEEDSGEGTDEEVPPADDEDEKPQRRR